MRSKVDQESCIQVPMFIINERSNEKFSVEIISISSLDFQSIKKNFKFNWKQQFQLYKVYKLCTDQNPFIIQGLIALEEREGYLFLPLIELAPFNIGKNKLYSRIADLLVAFAIEQSFDKGFDGAVSFIAKSSLVNHYKRRFNAKLITKNYMVIEGNSSRKMLTLLNEN